MSKKVNEMYKDVILPVVDEMHVGKIITPLQYYSLSITGDDYEVEFDWEGKTYKYGWEYKGKGLYMYIDDKLVVNGLSEQANKEAGPVDPLVIPGGNPNVEESLCLGEFENIKLVSFKCNN